MSVRAFFFFKQKTSYELRISDWSSDVCSSDLVGLDVAELQAARVDLPRRRSRAQDVGHLLQLELARRGLGDQVLVAFEARLDALEIEAGGQLAVGLVDGVGQLVGVDLGR